MAYVDDVQTLLEARCLRCHAAPAPAGGWLASSYSGAIGCGIDDVETALTSSTHAALVSEGERDRLLAWVRASAPATRPGVHPAGFANPRAPSNHAAFLRERLYRPLSDPNDADACGTCHDGAGARPPRVTVAAPGAPACTTCHAEKDGVQACGTCHGDGARSYPPKNPCLFPSTKPDRAHGTHVERGIGCATCHAVGAHQDGKVDVACAGTCHARGGARTSPAWSDAPMTCNDCHASPPKAHYAGECSSCHRVDERTHVNGKVDLGDGSGRCGACHGQGDDPRPSTGAHGKHAFTSCETCHEGIGPKHPLGGGAKVRLAGLATRGGRRPSFDPTSKSCAGTYCHEGVGASQPAPAWTGAATTCSSCHASPPPAPHPQATDCASCHPSGSAHVNGVLDLGVKDLGRP